MDATMLRKISYAGQPRRQRGGHLFGLSTLVHRAPVTANGGSNKQTKSDDDILWGTAEIGEELRRSERQAAYLLNSGLIRCAKKIGHQWTAVRGELRREVTQREREEHHA
jgi:hypothetical protein